MSASAHLVRPDAGQNRGESPAAERPLGNIADNYGAAVRADRWEALRFLALVAYVPGLNGQDVENGSALVALRRSIDAMRIAGEVPVPHVKPQALAWARGEQERPTYDPTALR